ncbi:unnamed protein product [Trichobilharzia regenti]|nr:unnamed protein product [Trichobilharzia regenti]
MLDVTESRMCPKCRMFFNTDDEFWRHNLNLDCDESISASAAASSMPGSIHSNNESRSNYQEKEDFEMNPTSSKHQSGIHLPAEAFEKCTDSPDLRTASIFCDVCQVLLTSIKNKEEHENGKMHKKRIGLKMKCSCPSVQNSLPSSIHSSDESQSVCASPQPTVRNRDEEIIRLLRHLCLTQTLSLLQKVKGDSHVTSSSDLYDRELKISANEWNIIEKFRIICREELRKILSEALQHASLQSRNVNT